jgi:5-formyltetrahydrofolate cyclo-ligase
MAHDETMPEPSAQDKKRKLRKEIWKYLEDHNIARFPRPVYNRIPNFVGAEEAAIRIRELKEFEKADVVKVNPDAPQAYVRQIVLEEGKTLLMPTPRLSAGFLKLDPGRIPPKIIRKAISISGAFKMAERIPLSKLPSVDLVVAGSVAVSLEGGRIGKGEGYSEFEYGILRECGLLSDSVKLVTTVHDRQLVEPFPVEEHDIPVDHILTPSKSHETRTRLHRPKGIYWELVTPEMLRRMPILAELRSKSQPK